jgi:hypothetical protein
VWFILATLGVPSIVVAQDQSSSWVITKSVFLDPATYTPSVLSYVSQRLDWDSSQPFFRHGDTEHNPGDTVSGRPDDVAISYDAGNTRILQRSISAFEVSLVNNVSNQVIQRVLISRHPEHRRLFHALGLVEPISFASYVSYQTSASHFSQWQVNEQLARQRGYR